jgi:hypothetical protein
MRNTKDFYSFIKIEPNLLKNSNKIKRFKTRKKREIFGLSNQDKIQIKEEESLLLMRYTNSITSSKQANKKIKLYLLKYTKKISKGPL